MHEDDGYDGVQHDTFYAPDPQQLEAEAIRRECAAEAKGPRADHVLITRPY